MKKYIFVFILVILTGCSKVSDETLIAAHKAVDNGAIIIDVRTPKEFKTKHIKNAKNFPLQELHNSYIRLPKDKEIVVYCRSGNRSATATKLLRQHGFTVYDVATQADWEREISIKQ